MFLGYRVHDRLDQRRFLTLTLAVLVLSGLNLLRRGRSFEENCRENPKVADGLVRAPLTPRGARLVRG